MSKFVEVRDDHGYMIRVPVKKAKPKTKPEADVQREIAKAFIADGWEVIRYNSGSMALNGNGESAYFRANINMNSGMSKGHPDLVASKNCRGVRIEAKSATGRLSDDQKKYAINAAKYGNPIVVLRSKEDALRLIELLKIREVQTAISIFQNTK